MNKPAFVQPDRVRVEHVQLTEADELRGEIAARALRIRNPKMLRHVAELLAILAALEG